MILNDPASIARALQRLMQAFTDAKIEEETPYNRAAYTLHPMTIRWRKSQSEGKVEIVFRKRDILWGDFECIIDMRGFAERSIILFPDDSEGTEALVAVIEYLHFLASITLFDASNGFQRRASNYLLQVLSGEQKHGIRKFNDLLLRGPAKALADERTKRANQLANEKERRGGSDAKLKAEEFKILHAQYAELHGIAKSAKKDCGKVFRQFVKAQGAKGFSSALWQKHWKQHLQANYSPQMIYDFLDLLSSLDRPSARQIALHKLSKVTGHATSYLSRLITASRKKATINSAK